MAGGMANSDEPLMIDRGAALEAIIHMQRTIDSKTALSRTITWYASIQFFIWTPET